MPRTNHLPFQKTLLAIAMGAALSPAWALELVQEPPLPTSKSAFVAPNVIISVDDSGSMEYCLTNSEAHESNSSMNTVPKRQENCWVGVDKNGKDIYCNDIVINTFLDKQIFLPDTITECAINGFYNYNESTYIVICNIYENPELLEQK